LIQDSDDEDSLGAAASKQSMEVCVSHFEQLEVVADIDYGDDKLFAELAKLHDHYYKWRRDHLNQPIIDDSPMYINCLHQNI